MAGVGAARGRRAAAPWLPFLAVGGLVAQAAASGGCHRVFACEQPSQCENDGIAGFCESTGYCSFPDPGCASGRRYGDHAASRWVGECVPGEPDDGSGTTGSDDGIAGSSSTSPTGPAGTTEAPGASSTGSATDDTSHDPCEGLVDSGPVVATADGEVISGLRITVDVGPAIEVDGFAGVTIRDCAIHHGGGPGISFKAAPDLTIENVVVVHDGAPASGPHDSGDQINIEGRDSTGVVIDGVRLERGSSGIELETTPAARLSRLEIHDVRGPGAGACVRVFDSDDAIIEDFSCENPLDTGRPGDLIAIAESSDVTVRRGLLDGHNAEFGYGVHFMPVAGQHSGGLVEDVDAINMTNGSFSCFPFGEQITFRRTRARENICEIVSIPIEGCAMPGPNGGCIPGSGGISWAASLTSSEITIEDSAYFDLCSSIVWPTENFTYLPEDLVEDDFELREPFRLSPCWEP